MPSQQWRPISGGQNTGTRTPEQTGSGPTVSCWGNPGWGVGLTGLFLILSLRSLEGEDLGLNGRRQVIPGATSCLQWEESQILPRIKVRMVWEA